MKKLYYILSFFLLISCKEKYESPAISPNTGYLVVEGVVNSGPGGTTIRLTRTTRLGNNSTNLERNALVAVEGENNVSYPLIEKAAGQYSADNLPLSSAQKYRLRINTISGKEFLSDFVEVRKNPPIDTLSYKREDEGLQLYIQTHDDQNKTKYYQWEYKETWEFQVPYRATLKYKYTYCIGISCPLIHLIYYDPTNIMIHDPTIITCWQSDTSNTLLLGSTSKLVKDIVYLPLIYIPPQSWKLSVLYSVNVKQYSWTKEGYEYLEKMKKNTEITGSVFDPQPSELKGNIHNVSDPNEPVIGFFSICNIEQKRFWIKNSDIPDWGYGQNCSEIEVENISDTIKLYASDLLPTVPTNFDRFGNITHFRAATPECVDCRLRGTNFKPAFWP